MIKRRRFIAGLGSDAHDLIVFDEGTDFLQSQYRFIAGLGSAAAWSLAASAQQGERVRRIGVLMGGDENDPEQKRRYSGFTQALADLGWTDGRNMRMDLRWQRGDINRIRALAQELVGLQPDIILAPGTPPLPSSGRRGRSR
jgi:putative ABC transport system substrate-binding protein